MISGTAWAMGGPKLVGQRAEKALADLVLGRELFKNGKITAEQLSRQELFTAECQRELANVRAGRQPWQNE